MIKQLVLASVIVLGGCATQAPAPTYTRMQPVVATPMVLPYYVMDTFKADCLYRPVTEQSRDYYTKLKNALWGLRSACGANR